MNNYVSTANGLLSKCSIYRRMNSVFADAKARSFSTQTIESNYSSVLGVIACVFVAAAFVAFVAFDFRRLRSAVTKFQGKFQLLMKGN